MTKQGAVGARQYGSAKHRRARFRATGSRHCVLRDAPPPHVEPVRGVPIVEEQHYDAQCISTSEPITAAS